MRLFYRYNLYNYPIFAVTTPLPSYSPSSSSSAISSNAPVFVLLPSFPFPFPLPDLAAISSPIPLDVWIGEAFARGPRFPFTLTFVVTDDGDFSNINKTN